MNIVDFVKSIKSRHSRENPDFLRSYQYINFIKEGAE